MIAPQIRRRAVHACLVLAAVGLIAACGARTNVEPVPVALTNEAVVPGFEEVRYLSDVAGTTSQERLIADRSIAIQRRADVLRRSGQPVEFTFLALSGGGQYGAFSAGILTAWTENGTRPVFDYVSGISTGSIIAPFAFLGPDYDDELTEIYTTLSTSDVVSPRVLSGLFGGTAFGDTAPLKAQIESYITPEFLDLIAAEHADGRRLFVGTTNLDTARAVIWDMGAIASSDDPRARDLFTSIILASAAIPVAFPPVFFEVEAGGNFYHEMHVDGGVTSQVSALSPQIPVTSGVQTVLPNVKRNLYVIVNGEALPPISSVGDTAVAIGGASVNTLWYSQTRGDLYRIYTTAQRDNVNVKFAWMDEDFTEKPSEEFDPVFMGALYAYGQEQIEDGTVWKSAPPGFVAR